MVYWAAVFFLFLLRFILSFALPVILCVVDELVAILSRDCPVPEQSAAFHTFVQLFCSCSKLSCVNLRQLRHLVCCSIFKLLN